MVVFGTTWVAPLGVAPWAYLVVLLGETAFDPLKIVKTKRGDPELAGGGFTFCCAANCNRNTRNPRNTPTQTQMGATVCGGASPPCAPPLEKNNNGGARAFFVFFFKLLKLNKKSKKSPPAPRRTAVRHRVARGDSPCFFCPQFMRIRPRTCTPPGSPAALRNHHAPVDLARPCEGLTHWWRKIKKGHPTCPKNDNSAVSNMATLLSQNDNSVVSNMAMLLSQNENSAVPNMVMLLSQNGNSVVSKP